MATHALDSDSNSDSDYGYDLTAEEEHLVSALVEDIPPLAAAPAVRGHSTTPPSWESQAGSTSSPPKTIEVAAVSGLPTDVVEALDDLDENDLSFDISELEEPNAGYSHGPEPSEEGGPQGERKLSPFVSRDANSGLASFVFKTRPRSFPTTTLAEADEADVSYPDLSRALSDVQKTRASSAPAAETTSESETPAPKTNKDTKAPPIIRFRTFPKKPFSVSDLTAGSWCELQYYYTLTRLPGGKRTRTAAMKGGTEIHEKLEREVYTTVQVDVKKKEDAFGLKLWNIIQGLRTLRDTGLTRELEVWGLIDGNVVNGVIDGLSYKNPDPDLEEDVLSSRGSQSTQDAQQQKITEYFASGTSGATAERKEIFITDVKTRASDKPPSQAAMRAAIIQLFLYHRFLSQMASDKLDYLGVFGRYGLDPDGTFSDAFMAQIGSLHDEVFYDADSHVDSISAVTSSSRNGPSSLSSPYTPEPDLIRYRSLRALLPLLKFEIQLTFPHGASSLGQIVAVEYRRRRPAPDDSDSDSDGDGDGDGEERRGGSVICVNSFYVDKDLLDRYLTEDQQWWRGEREPRGVPLVEAFKCRSCEFVDTCEWRNNLDQEALRKARLKRLNADDVSGRQSQAFNSGGGGRQKRMASTQW
ncbi:exonuclease V [Diplogelasinospora grovesii]|uniref:Exonuclease V n=1 Tax=Diplogelasinospora grovesii TaxID=303347 RepID=A0AAN6MZC6_9PEZI|nr:exonuclease V [Diplogelasinospora grovesii]